MPKLLITDAAKYYQGKGDTAITKNYLYAGCRSGILPHCKIGNRYIICTEELDKYLLQSISGSVKQEPEPEQQYGVLRKIQ